MAVAQIVEIIELGANGRPVPAPDVRFGDRDGEKELLADFSDEEISAMLRICERVETRIEKAKSEMKAQ